MKVLRIAKTIGKWAVVALVFLFILEASARVDDWFTWRTPLLSNDTEEVLRVGDSLGLHLRPGASFEKWRVNSMGFRGSEITREKPSGVVRVAVVGASESFGMTESAGMDYPAQMQRLFDSLAPGKYQVLNAACPGATIPTVQYYFDKWVVQFQPDFVIYYPTPAFYLYDKPVADSQDISGLSRWRPHKQYLRIMKKARIVLRELIPPQLQTFVKQHILPGHRLKTVSGWTFETIPEDRLKLFEKHLRLFVKDFKIRGIPLILATHGTRFGEVWNSVEEWHLKNRLRVFPRASREAYLGFDPAANEVIRRVGSEYRARVVDIAHLIPRRAVYWADAAHFTDQGAGLVARIFVKEVLDLQSPAQAASAR